MIVREVLNGLSMIVPATVLAFNAPTTKFGLTAVLGSALHAPISCGYHWTCAAHLNTDNVNCVGRKLDQTFIHVNAALLAYSTSHSINYAAAAAALNTRYIRLLWVAGSHDTPAKRRLRVAIAILVYVAPVFLQNARLAARMVLSLVASSAAFVFDKKLKGAGHTAFHLGLGLMCLDLAKVV